VCSPSLIRTSRLGECWFPPADYGVYAIHLYFLCVFSSPEFLITLYFISRLRAPFYRCKRVVEPEDDAALLHTICASVPLRTPASVLVPQFFLNFFGRVLSFFLGQPDFDKLQKGLFSEFLRSFLPCSCPDVSTNPLSDRDGNGCWFLELRT